jgi:hypothetical protein
MVSIRQRKLEESGQKVVSWSNGNIFRSVTLLACHMVRTEWPFPNLDSDKALSKDNCKTTCRCSRLTENTFDTRIRGLGLELYVSDVQNTLLKEPKVRKEIFRLWQNSHRVKS